MVSRWLTPLSGRIQFAGHDINGKALRASTRLDMCGSRPVAQACRSVIVSAGLLMTLGIAS